MIALYMKKPKLSKCLWYLRLLIMLEIFIVILVLIWLSLWLSTAQEYNSTWSGLHYFPQKNKTDLRQNMCHKCEIMVQENLKRYQLSYKLHAPKKFVSNTCLFGPWLNIIIQCEHNTLVSYLNMLKIYCSARWPMHVGDLTRAQIYVGRAMCFEPSQSNSA